MEEIRIPNRATYFPVALSDLIIAAPLVSRVLFRTSVPGRIVASAAAGAYVGSAMKDWLSRRSVKRVDFPTVFGTDLRRLQPMPEEARVREVQALTRRLNDEYVAPPRWSRRELAREVNQELTRYLAGLTGQWVDTSSEVRDFMLLKLVFPFAVGGCDALSGDIAIFRDTGVFEPHVLAHELAHRKGYFKELEAQALAYLALSSSGRPELAQSTLCERLYRQMAVLAQDDVDRFHAILDACGLRPELAREFRSRQPRPSPGEQAIGSALRWLYHQRMRLTAQNGISDYDLGFTNFLHTIGA